MVVAQKRGCGACSARGARWWYHNGLDNAGLVGCPLNADLGSVVCSTELPWGSNFASLRCRWCENYSSE